jgi:hypothetical protein
MGTWAGKNRFSDWKKKGVGMALFQYLTTKWEYYIIERLSPVTQLLGVARDNFDVLVMFYAANWFYSSC